MKLNRASVLSFINRVEIHLSIETVLETEKVDTNNT